jgi:hypothetical protein
MIENVVWVVPDFPIRIKDGKLVPISLDELLGIVRTIMPGYRKTGLQAFVFTPGSEVRKIDVFHALGKAEEEWGFTEPLLVEGPDNLNAHEPDHDPAWRWVWEETEPDE